MPAPAHAALADRIRALREARGLTQGQLANVVGVDQTTVSSWETGASRPRPRTLETVARELGASLADLQQAGGYPQSVAVTGIEGDPVVAYYRAHADELNTGRSQHVLLTVMRGLVETAPAREATGMHVNLWDLKPGERIRTEDDAIAEVIAPTVDGQWVRVRYLECAENPSIVGTEDLSSGDEIAERLLAPVANH